MTRRDKIELMLNDEPGDLFLRYSLAMELEKEGEHDASLAKFIELSQERPSYVPAFFMAGQLLTRLGRFAGARAVLRDGIDAARDQGDLHAAAEMSEYLITLDGAD
jgi:hypothetical protein